MSERSPRYVGGTTRAMLENFVVESNRIEGIEGACAVEVAAHADFVTRDVIDVRSLTEFVTVVQPDAVLRDQPGLNVRVGKHVPPLGGPSIPDELNILLELAMDLRSDPYEVHVDYETLHPFTDGNGRSGRALWLWMMARRNEMWPALRRGFLHSWYYQSLEHART